MVLLSEKLTIYHGSEHIIDLPMYKIGKPYNDYGQGFYCTKEIGMAKEWACKNNKNGFVNKYELNLSRLNIINLLDEKYNILNWMAILLKNRTFRTDSEIAVDARKYIIDNFFINTDNSDVIIGYRADDSYFSFAQLFLENGLSVDRLNTALRLGDLGEQIVLASETAFKNIKFLGFEEVSKEIYYDKFFSRDFDARQKYKNEIKAKSPYYKDDLFVLDILREELKSDDARIQRILSK